MTGREPVGVVGAGSIGGGLARALRRAGVPVTACDVRPATLDALVADTGVEPASSPAEVAQRARLVFVAVLDEAQVEAVVLGDRGLVAGADGRHVVVTLSTITVAGVRRLATALHARCGATLIDAGVTGLPGAAERGELVVMGGGDAGAIERVRLGVAGAVRSVVRVGPIGSGMAAKLARNLATYGFWAVVDEMSRLAEAAGVELAQLLAIIRESDPSGRMPWALLEGRLDPTRPVDPAASSWMDAVITKDLGGAIELAESLGVTVDVARLTRSRSRDILGLPSAAPPTGGSNEQGVQ